MRAIPLCLVLILALVFNTVALKCHTHGGIKEDELKSIYMTCLKRLDRNSSESRNYSGERNRDSQDRRRHSQEYRGHEWGEERGRRRDDNRREDNRRDSYRDGYGMNREGSENTQGMGYGMRGDSMRSDDGYDRMNRDNNRMNRDNGYEMNYGDMSNSRYPSTMSPRRYKRQINQYKHQQSASSRGPSKFSSEDSNSRENSTRNSDRRACAIHCFLQELEMVTPDNDLPDRYLVAHYLSKEVTNRELKEFIQESVDDCFQILYNENIQEKCDFSKTLMMCLVEKGQNNCDDWKEDVNF